MKKVAIAFILLAGAYYTVEHFSLSEPRAPAYDQTNAALEDAIRSRREGYQVHGSGRVVRLLPDDMDGSRHQRFTVRLESGQTLLIAHNTDLAPKVAGLESNQIVSFFGEYEWNERGGVIHWTHHDPRGQHVAGWLEYNGRRYQ